MTTHITSVTVCDSCGLKSDSGLPASWGVLYIGPQGTTMSREPQHICIDCLNRLGVDTRWPQESEFTSSTARFGSNTWAVGDSNPVRPPACKAEQAVQDMMGHDGKYAQTSRRLLLARKEE